MNARVAAMRARRELEFLEICQDYSDRLDAAKAAVREARESGGEAFTLAWARMKEVGREVHEFRKWARTVGKPAEGVPGRDAVIQVGG
ncbi:hypothetical protein ACIBEJ_35115 [Nonomuraea sp. NPDC050790]|uniref:hypothetical protein n=1 Tax=Nonomuraea sp. NPDC050790 TaxID=3364371 RepID=UPI0037B1B19B